MLVSGCLGQLPGDSTARLVVRSAKASNEIIWRESQGNGAEKDCDRLQEVMTNECEEPRGTDDQGQGVTIP